MKADNKGGACGSLPLTSARISNGKGSHRVLFLLAGGAGTRLKSVVSEVPKALAPIGGRPFLSILLEQYAKEGANTIVLCLHHQAEQIEDYVASLGGQVGSCQIKCVVEPRPLDTGGALRYALQEYEKLSEPAVEIGVANADSFIPGAYAKLLETPFAAPTLDCAHLASVFVSNVAPYGELHLHAEGRVLGFTEKGGKVHAGMVYAGVALLKARLVRAFAQDVFSLERDFFPKLIREDRVWACGVETSFIDIGTPRTYAQFCQDHLTRPDA